MNPEIPKEIIVLIALYSIPMARLALFFLPGTSWSPVRKLNAVIGHIEWLIRWFRDSLILAVLVALAAYGAYQKALFPTAYYTFFALVSLFSIVRLRFHLRRMAEFARKNPTIYPKLFFECYYAGFGIFPFKPSSIVNEVITPADCSFKSKDNPGLRLWPVIAGVFNTATLAKMIMSAMRSKGAEYAREVSASVSTIWGSRAAQLGRLSVKLVGAERLEGLDGKFIFAFNHKSFLDFAIGPFALFGFGFDMRFMAARDHFLDNLFLYLIMGRAMEVIGTIFVDRKKKISSPKSSSIKAAESLADFPLSIVIYPQGTRAYKNLTADGKRLDSGYYTSGTKDGLKKVGGHLKKGAAHIAVDTAILLKRHEGSRVNIIPVALIGTGLACPKKCLKVRSNTDIVVKIGHPITIAQSDVESLDIGTSEYLLYTESIHTTLDERLKTLLETHAWLEQRFFKDIRGLLAATDFEHVSVAMKAWRGKDYLIYTILDCIYATAPKYWHEWLRGLCNLLISDVPAGTFVHFRERVIDCMIDEI